MAQLWYEKRSPGPRLGCFPTTPSPLTSSTRPLASVMIQWRLRSCAGTDPTLAISTVYMKAKCPASGAERSGQKAGVTVMRIPSVVVLFMARWILRLLALRPDQAGRHRDRQHRGDDRQREPLRHLHLDDPRQHLGADEGQHHRQP